MGVLVAELLFRDTSEDSPSSHAERLGQRPATAPESDASLIARLRCGDRSAEETIFLTHYAALVGYARRFTPSVELAEEAAQDSLVRFLGHQRQLSPNLAEEIPHSIPALLRTIVRRHILDQWKHDRRVRRAHEGASAIGTPLGSAHSLELPDIMVERTEVARAIRDAFDALPPRTRLVAMMRWSDGLGRQAIAAELGTSVRTVDAQLYQAADRIRSALRHFR